MRLADLDIDDVIDTLKKRRRCPHGRGLPVARQRASALLGRVRRNAVLLPLLVAATTRSSERRFSAHREGDNRHEIVLRSSGPKCRPDDLTGFSLRSTI
jgi:hypothetical protein